MAEFNGVKLTNAGRNILAKALLGKPLKFTCAWVGDGYSPADDEIPAMTQIVSPHSRKEIAEMSIPPHIGTANITVIFTNKELTTGFFLREVGLFAEDPDTGEELLYGYANAGDTADYMPGYGGADTVYYRFNLTVIVDQAKNVTAVFSENPLAVTHQQLEAVQDSLLKHFREREALLQYQIDCLAEASIINSLEHVGQKHFAG